MKRTRVTFGCSLSPHYIDYNAYELLTSLIRLPPSDSIKLCDLVVFDVGPGSKVFSDIHCVLPTTLTTTHSTIRKTLTINSTSVKRTSFDRIQIHDENVIENNTLLKPTSRFSDLQFIMDRYLVTMNGWDHKCKYYIGQRWACPYKDIDHPQYSYFKGPPVYEITLLLDGHVDTTTILKIVNSNLPRVYGRF